MEILLVTDRWPNGVVTEFLDEEIFHLARAFDKVIVAPVRPPSGSANISLPKNVFVDYSLAKRLSSFGPLGWHAPRKVVVGIRSLVPKRFGFGVNRIEFRNDGSNLSWLKACLIGRSDFASVTSWAAGRAVPDVAYTFWLNSATAALRAAWPMVPIVSRVHRGDLYSEANGWQSIPFQSNSIQAVDLLASVSEDGRTYLAKKMPRDAQKIVTRRLGVPDLGKGFETISGVNSLNILSASSIIPVKRVDLILRVMQTLVSSGMRVNWTHLGDGPEKCILERALSAEQSDSLQVDLRGQVSLEEVRREMALGRHDLFINLSMSEGAPVSLMEAQSAGIPVVATDVGGTREVVSPALNELVSTSAGPPEICAAIGRAMKRDPQESIKRRQHWASFYNSEVNYASWSQELRQLSTLRATKD
jgi:glycosyltransferase involved in cell wall biosynthesis